MYDRSVTGGRVPAGRRGGVRPGRARRRRSSPNTSRVTRASSWATSTHSCGTWTTRTTCSSRPAWCSGTSSTSSIASRSFVAWACGVARYEVMSFLRARSRDRLYFSDELSLALIEAQEALEQERLEERRVALAGCMKRLTRAGQGLARGLLRPVGRGPGGGPGQRPVVAEHPQLAEADPPCPLRVRAPVPRARGGGMSGDGRDELPAEFLDLIDDYCSGLIDESRGRTARGLLCSSSAEARRHFAEYFQHHTEIHFAVRAGRAAEAVLERLAIAGEGPRGRDVERRGPEPSAPGVARSLDGPCGPAGDGRGGGPLAGLRGGPVASAAAQPAASRPRRTSRGWSMPRTAGGTTRSSVRAETWATARNFTWPGGWPRSSSIAARGSSSRDRPACGSLSGRSVQLLKGTSTARVPGRARGFTVLTPHNKVVDLGTEFGLSVDDRGCRDRSASSRVRSWPIRSSPTAPPIPA